MVTFKFKRICVDYCEIDAPDIDSALEIIYSGLADWSHDETIEISDITDESNI